MEWAAKRKYFFGQIMNNKDTRKLWQILGRVLETQKMKKLKSKSCKVDPEVLNEFCRDHIEMNHKYNETEIYDLRKIKILGSNNLEKISSEDI